MRATRPHPQDTAEPRGPHSDRARSTPRHRQNHTGSGPGDDVSNRHFAIVVAGLFTDNHGLAYSNAGSIISPSFVPPASTILLSGSNLRLS
jgi:hypothetical protein